MDAVNGSFDNGGTALEGRTFIIRQGLPQGRHNPLTTNEVGKRNRNIANALNTLHRCAHCEDRTLVTKDDIDDAR
jgi:hypothetical protein